MADQKKSRIPNFSPVEKEFLFNIALRYTGILEDKKTNRSGLEEKAKAWKIIESEFNNTAPILAYRNQEQLKRLYENRKKDLRKKLADHKKEVFLTGGGAAPTDIVLDKVDTILSQILNEKTLKGFHSEFDSDALIGENFEPKCKRNKTDILASNHTSVQPEIVDMDNVQVFEFVPLELEGENIETYDNVVKHDKQSGRCPPTILKDSINPKLLPTAKTATPRTSAVNQSSIGIKKTPSSDRRRPVGGLRALTSSDVSEKYNVLLDKRLVLVEKQLEHSIEIQNFDQEQHKQKIKNLKLEEENLILAKEEKTLKIELLKTEITYKRSLISTSSI